MSILFSTFQHFNIFLFIQRNSYSIVQMNASYVEQVKNQKGMLDYISSGVSSLMCCIIYSIIFTFFNNNLNGRKVM
jgi:hypothetical protein